MTTAEAVAAIERLVEAGRRATGGKWSSPDGPLTPSKGDDGCFVLYVDTNNIGETCDREEPDFCSSGEGEAARIDGKGNADFIVVAANARPALSALAGMCVLDVEVVRLLLGLCKNHYDTSTLPAWHQDQFAAAEAELRRVEP